MSVVPPAPSPSSPGGPTVAFESGSALKSTQDSWIPRDGALVDSIRQSEGRSPQPEAVKHDQTAARTQSRSGPADFQLSKLRNRIDNKSHHIDPDTPSSLDFNPSNKPELSDYDLEWRIRHGNCICIDGGQRKRSFPSLSSEREDPSETETGHETNRISSDDGRFSSFIWGIGTSPAVLLWSVHSLDQPQPSSRRLGSSCVPSGTRSPRSTSLPAIMATARAVARQSQPRGVSRRTGTRWCPSKRRLLPTTILLPE